MNLLKSLTSKSIPVSSAATGIRTSLIPDWAFLAGFCVIFTLQTLLGVAQKSATYDEPSDLVSGYMELTQSNYWLKPETLPLTKLIGALPLALMHVRRPQIDWHNPWVFYDQFLYQANHADILIGAARAMVLPLSLLLGCLVFFWTRQLFGRGAARFALFLYCFEPNIIAHSPLVTSDLGVACFFFLTVYGLYLLTQRVTLFRFFIMAFAFSLAIVTKLSMAMLFPILTALGLISCMSRVEIPIRIPGLRIRSLASRGHKLIAFSLMLCAMCFVAYGVIWATYQFGYHAAPSIKSQHLPDWSVLATEGTFRGQAMHWFLQNRVLPEPYVYNFFYHLRTGRFFPAYLMGTVREGGWWYFFLITFLIKTPISLLILIGCALGAMVRQWHKRALANMFLVVPPAAYFAFISASGFNIGHRHLLGVLPFLMVLAGLLVPWAAQQRTWIKRGVAVLALWYLGSSFSVFPHYLAYFNELAGGPGNGWRYLVDSNLDWGQDLKALKIYMDRQGIKRIWLSYFGMANPDFYKIRYDPLPGSMAIGMTPAQSELLALERLPQLAGTVAISATNLQGVYLPLVGVKREYFETYRNLRPIAKIGYSIFIYRTEGKDFLLKPNEQPVAHKMEVAHRPNGR